MSLTIPEVDMNEVEAVEAVETTASVQVEEAVATNEVAVVEEASTEVAIAGVAKPSEKRESGIKAFIAEQADEGFEDLDVGAFSFDRIKLEEGRFVMGQEDIDMGEKFQFKVLATRGLYTVSQSSDEDSKMFYSYSPDGSTKIDGESSAEILDDWKDQGFACEDMPLIIKKYLEVTIELCDRTDEYNEAIVMLQIPPASLQRFGGVAFMAKQRYKTSVGGVVVEASVGAKAGEGKKSFRPWNFKVLRLA